MHIIIIIMVAKMAGGKDGVLHQNKTQEYVIQEITNHRCGDPLAWLLFHELVLHLLDGLLY